MIRALSVEDSRTTSLLLKSILSAKVKAIAEDILALSSSAAMRQNTSMREGCDLLVSDVMMPNLDGFELTAKLRSDKRYKNLPVVLVTPRDSPADRERGAQTGADAYIVKDAFDQAGCWKPWDG